MTRPMSGPHPDHTGELAAFLSRPSWEVAPELVGWQLETTIDGLTTAVTITEVEAYDQTDPASHSFRGPTSRTRTMFGPPGGLYVYRSYGLHWCMNIVTGPDGHGAAVLLRSGRPLSGREAMSRRRGREDHLTDGPGKLTQALGIEGRHDGLLLGDGPVVMRPGPETPLVIATPRIGITKAAEKPWRFVATGGRWVF